MDHDSVLARQLQEEFDRELAQKASGSWGNDVEIMPPPNTSASKPLSIVDPSWEMTDPSPDIRALFLQYNDQYFWGKLAGIEVKWSPRMTLCAGLCCYEGRGGLCSVRLSTPLLQLRPRKDLVETLLHEMIHAYLFVTQNNKDHDGHGPEFQKHMNRLNNLTGTKISIYHNFHDEVNHFRQHWWRCNGPCQSRKPYFGYVKRAMNRAPSPKDFWWAEHQKTCGGSYTKVKEPDGYGKKKGKSKDKTDIHNIKEEKTDSKPGNVDKVKSGNMDIRIFGGKGVTLGSRSSKSVVVGSAGAIVKSETTENGQTEGTVKIQGVHKPPATITKSESENISNLPKLPELPEQSLLERISRGEGNKTSSSGSSNNVQSGFGIPLSDKKKSEGGSTVSGVSVKKVLDDSSGDPRNRINGGNSPGKDRTSPGNCTTFPGGGQALGQGSSSGKGTLAMLRKSWAAEKKSEKKLLNSDYGTSRVKLDIPRNGQKKRNSSEFCDSNSDSKKSRLGDTPEQSFSGLEGDGKYSKKVNHEPKDTDKKRANPCWNVTHGPIENSGAKNDAIVIGSPVQDESTSHPCPVCQTRVPATLMNQHLDRCLGM